MRLAAMVMLAVALSGCAEVAMYGEAAAERRRTMNDLQARGTLSAVCDISIGSYWRTMTPVQRVLADQQCGGIEALQLRVSE